MQKQSNGIVWALALPFGVGTGVLWIAIAIFTFGSASRGFANDRVDWGVGWGLVAVLLLLAGLSAVLGTLWHRRLVQRHY